jgi:putative transposase
MLTYKRKLILTKAQEKRIDSWMGVCRMVYNMALEIEMAAWRNKQTFISRNELSKQLKDIRTVEWVGDLPFESMEFPLKFLDRAYASYFKRFKEGVGIPKFKSKKGVQSVSFKTVKISGTKIWVQKLGYLKVFKDAEIVGVPKQATIRKEIDGYFISVTCKDAKRSIQNSDENQVIGLDMGVSHFVVDSNGVFIANPKHFKNHERRLRIENRSLGRKKKGSANWKKQARKLAKIHKTISNVRKDFLHKLSSLYAKSYHTVYLEDLNVKGMAKNRCLSKHILDCGWADFRRMLEYKTTVIAVDPRYTSQICNDCGAKDAKSRISQSSFVCTSCGSESNADLNASLNILSRGMAYVRERKTLV